MEQSEEKLLVPKGIKPTDEQTAIQRSRDPYVIVEAAAGAAKTTTLALRLAQAIARAAPPRSLLGLTYTQPAVQALHATLQFVGVPASVRTRLRIRTFEDFARESLRDYERAIVPTYDAPEKLRPFVLAAIGAVLESPAERHFDQLSIPGSGDAVVESYLKDFFHLKGTMQLARDGEGRKVTPALASELGRDYTMLRVFLAYERERHGGNPDHPRFRAFGDATYDLARLLTRQDEPELRRQLRERGFSCIVLDEMHDTNRAMFTVLQTCLEVNRQSGFVGVGDRDQVIHATAGAQAEFMGESFEWEIARAKRFPLSASYRFGSDLAKAAGRISRKTCTSRASHKTVISARRCDSRLGQCEAALEAAVARQGLAPKAVMSQFAILLRHPTNRFPSKTC